MSLKFNEAFDILMEKIPQCDLLVPKLFSDTEELVQKINQAFHDINSIFQGTLMNLIETSIIHADNHRAGLGLVLKMPFKITSTKVHQVEGIWVYNLKADVHHPVVQGGYVIPLLIVYLFETDFKRALAHIGQVNCKSGKTYTLSVTLGYIDGTAVFQINTFASGIQIEDLFFTFPLVYKFESDSNTYLGTMRHFTVFNQTPLEKGKEYIRKVVDLMMHLNANKCLNATKPQVFYAISLAISATFCESLIEMTLECLKQVISVSVNPERLSFVYNKLMHFKQSDRVDLAELMALFGLH